MNAGYRSAFIELGERTDSRDARISESSALRAIQSGDDAQMIGGFPLILAFLLPAAELAMSARLGERLPFVVSDEADEASARAVAVVDVVRDPEPEHRAVSEQYFGVRGEHPLHGFDHARV